MSSTSSSTCTDGGNLRRSKRERKSTTIQIGRHTVLAKNNYVVRGDEYIFNSFPPNDEKVKEKVKPNNAKPNNAKPNNAKPKQKQKQSEAQIQHQQRLALRSEHNNSIRTEIGTFDVAKWAFMVDKRSILRPFLDGAVWNKLDSIWDGGNASNSSSNANSNSNSSGNASGNASGNGNGKKNIGHSSGKKSDIDVTSVRKLLFNQDNNSNITNNNNTVEKVETVADMVMVHTQPKLVQTTLREYQLLGLDWMVQMHNQGLGMILADEMGLGKTLQTISLIAYLKEHSAIANSPTLVICPLSVLYSWINEINKHAPTLKHFRLHASDDIERSHQKEIMTKHILEYDLIITTYDMAKSPKISRLFSNIYFHYVVLDEGHIIKDRSTQISAAVRKLHSRNKLLLTGTPLQNNLVELYSILNYLYPDVFVSDASFRNAFDIGNNIVDKDMLLKANKMLSLFMLRRLKGEVEKFMPKKIETKIFCPLSTAQIFWYKGYLLKDIDHLIKVDDNENDDGGSGSGSGSGSGENEQTPSASRHNVLRNLIMQLRKCCLHPFLFSGAEASIEKTTLEELVSSSGKLSVLDKMLRSMFQKGNRTVIFSQFTAMLDILEDYCMMRGWRYCRFDGGTPRAQRNYIINQFNAPESDCFIFLMSTRSGGLGINLQTADTCILYDSDWNPQPDIQAMARVHRIGQKKTVHVYRLVSSGTVEERILQRAEKKLFLDQMVNRGASGDPAEGDDQEGTRLTTSELLSTLKFGSNAIFRSTNELPSDLDIDTITDRNRSEETSVGLLQGGASKTANDFKADEEMTDTQTFDGIDFRELRGMQKDVGVPKSKQLKKLKEEWKDLNVLADPDGGRGKRQKFSRLMSIKDDNGTSHQVFAENNYDLENGEPSVFSKETRKTSGMSNPKRKKTNVVRFSNQDFCQICGDFGEIIMCPRCPVSVHPKCCGMTASKYQCCSHHNCFECGKGSTAAGGLLFACQSCPACFCEDCLPPINVRYLGTTVERFEKLGYEGNERVVYIHCSTHCENVAKMDFQWQEPLKKRMKCPLELDVSYAFGKHALSISEIAKKRQTLLRKVSSSESCGSLTTTSEKLADINNIPKTTPQKRPLETFNI